MRGHRSIRGLIVAITLFSPSQAPAERAELCTHSPENPAARETAECTRIIADRRQSPERRAKAYVNRGRMAALAARFDHAIADFDRSIALQPDQTAAYLE